MLNSNYLQLSSFYFFFFATLGAMVPFWALYLKSIGFSEIQIGELLAVLMASKLFSPFLLGWLSDHLNKRLLIVQASMLLAVFAFSGILLEQSYWWMFTVMMLFGFFWNSAMPLFEALTLKQLANKTNNYSLIRLWGSIGFIIAVILLPHILEGDNISLLPICVLLLLLVTTISSLFAKDQTKTHPPTFEHNLFSTLKNPVVLALLLACCLQTLSHGVYYTFFTIYLEEHGYSRELAGWMWALGVVAEVILFLLMRRLLHYFSVYQLFVWALAVTAVRWLVLAYWIDSYPAVIIAQLMHAASFGLFHAAEIYLIYELFPGKLQARGQALYAGMSFGLGGTLGHLMSGYLWTNLGAEWSFVVSSCCALLATIIAMLFIKKELLPDYAFNK